MSAQLTLPRRETARAPFELLATEMQRVFGAPKNANQNSTQSAQTQSLENTANASSGGEKPGEKASEPALSASIPVGAANDAGGAPYSSSLSVSSSSKGSKGGRSGDSIPGSTSASAAAGGEELLDGGEAPLKRSLSSSITGSGNKLEAMGFDVGRRLCERIARARAAGSAHPFLVTNLDCVKFLCRELWECFFGGQINSLRTNRRGTFVLTDNELKWLRRLPPASSSSPTAAGSTPKDPAAASAAGDRKGDDKVDKKKADGGDMYTEALVYPCGLIRGALSALGLECTVSLGVRQGVFFGLPLYPFPSFWALEVLFALTPRIFLAPTVIFTVLVTSSAVEEVNS
jgi:trafficking protein particle complex subunit 6